VTNPARALFGPLFQKEVRSSGRRRSTYIGRAAFVAALLGILLIVYSGMERSPRVSMLERLAQLQVIAPALALTVIWFQFITLALAAPILASPAICDERRARTLSALLTTPLTGGQIILGKLSSRLVQLVILSLMTAPVLLAIRIFGGLDAGAVLAALALALSTALLAAALAVMYSIWHRRATSAAVFAILTLVLLQVGPACLELLRVMAFQSGAFEEAYHEEALATMTFYAMGTVHETIDTGRSLLWVQTRLFPFWQLLGSPRDPAGAPVPVAIAPVWLVATLYNLLITLLVCLLSIGIFRRLLVREAFAEGSSDTPARPRWRLWRRRRAATAAPGEAAADHPADPTHPATAPTAPPAPPPARIERERRIREVSDRPVFWRELRRSAIRSPILRWAAVYLSLAGLILLYANYSFREDGLHMSLAFLAGGLVMLMPVFMTTGGIAAEREARTWETLLTAPLTARDIVLGKFAGALRGMWFLPGVLLGHFVVACTLGFVPWVFLGHLVLILIGPVLLLSATGQLYSLIFRRGVTASVMNLLTALTLWLGLWIVLGLMRWFGAFDEFDWFPTARDSVFALNPVAMIDSAADPTIGMGGGLRMRVRTLEYSLSGPGKIGFWAFTRAVLLALLLYLAATFAVLEVAIAGFRRWSGRAS
jgi:ABC-type transport system involved in multi-copper enzyme maturation permease subunit